MQKGNYASARSVLKNVAGDVYDDSLCVGRTADPICAERLTIREVFV